MCLGCRLDLPLTNYHLNAEFNPLVERLLCHAPITRATAYFHYERLSPYARLIHAAKYEGQPGIGKELAAEYARILLPNGFFNGIDAIVAVPLSRIKLIKRGYNQSLHIAEGISAVTGIPIIAALKARHHSSQTRKDAHQRFVNTSGTYRAVDDALQGVGHILLVDDVATTGATLCACAEAIHAIAPAAGISVFTIASTRLS